MQEKKIGMTKELFENYEFKQGTQIKWLGKWQQVNIVDFEKQEIDGIKIDLIEDIRN